MTAGWLVVARKDVADAGRSRALVTTAGVLVALIGLLYLLEGTVDGTAPADIVSLLGIPLLVVVPIAALTVGYRSIVGERQSGRLKVLLGLSPGRRDVVVGTFVGRTAVVFAAIAAGFVAAVGCSLLIFRSVPIVDLFALLFVTGLFGLSFVGVAVGISASTATRGRAIALAIGLYLAVALFWDLFVTGIYALVTGELPGVTVEPWFFLLERLSPVFAYETLASAVIRGEVTHFVSISARPPEASAAPLSEQIAGAVPVYLEPWMTVPILLGWALSPLLVGLVRFRRADL